MDIFLLWTISRLRWIRIITDHVKLYALDIDGENLTDITSSFFPDESNINYMFTANEPRFKDFNNDGLLDIYFWGGWSTTLNEKESLFLINITIHLFRFHKNDRIIISNCRFQ